MKSIYKKASLLAIALILFLKISIAKTPPNIVLFITDDQFKTTMPFMPEGQDKNGKPKYYMPTVEKLSKEGTVMLQQYVTSPVCTPSRYSCMTGKFPSRSTSHQMTHKTKRSDGQTVVMWNAYVTENDTTLAQILKQNGYYTGIVGKNHVIEYEGRVKPEWLANPNDPTMLSILKNNDKLQKEACKKAGFDYAKRLYEDNSAFIGVKAFDSHNMDWVTKGALDFIDKNNKTDKPFFLWLATTIPHGPHNDERTWKANPKISALGMLGCVD